MPLATLNPKKAKQAKQARETSAPIPMQGERQEQFFDRAMRALAKSIPSVNRRTIEVLRLWRESTNDEDLRHKASLQFRPNHFTHFDPRCIFLEHTVPAREGDENGNGARPAITYDRKALQKLVDWANYRLRDSGTYSAISDGHTPSRDELATGAPMPDVLGYAGPFYLGVLGDLDPKWAIYADEWIHNEDLNRFAKLQRRSPEVWVNEPIERRTMDPIAAIGSEAPRLDSGMNPYSRAGDGQTVIRYSMGMAAFPGPSNTFVPGAATGKSKKPAGKPDVVDYSGASPMNPPNAAATADAGSDVENDVDPKIVAIVTQAIQGLMPSLCQAVQQALSEDAADQGADLESTNERPEDVDDASEFNEPGDEVDDTTTNVPRGSDSPAPNNPEDAEDKTMNGAAAKPPVDDEEKKYQAMGAVPYAAYCAGKKAASMKYSRSHAQDDGRGDGSLHAVVAKQRLELDKLRRDIEGERRDRARYSRLHELSQDFAFDVDEEAETCFGMTDQQFTRHCEKTVTKYSRRDDLTGVDLYVDPSVPADKYGRGQEGRGLDVRQVELYSRQAAQIAAQKNATKRGSTTFEAEFDALVKQHGAAI